LDRSLKSQEGQILDHLLWDALGKLARKGGWV
jgi:hypothetical protein